MKNLFLSAALLLCCAARADGLRYMIVETTDGKSINYTIENVESLTFAAPESGTPEKQDATVSRIYFSETEVISTAIDGAETQLTVSAFPNPVCGTLHIKGAADGAAYAIVNLSGQTVMQGTGSSIDVTALPYGAYLLKVDGATLKFIKK